MCEYCEKDELIKVEIVYHYIGEIRDSYFGKVSLPKETRIKINNCPMCGRDLRRE